MKHTFAKALPITPTALSVFALVFLAPHCIKGQSTPKPPPNPDGIARPEELYRPPSIRERQAQMDALMHDASRPRTPKEERLALEEINDDFKQIQLINNKMMGATMSSALPNYASIAETTAEIRKRAIRIRKNLQLPKPDESEAKDSEPQKAENAKQLKAALLVLDDCIMSFIKNPIFVNPEVIDIEQAARARRDLEKIIQQSQLIGSDAERLKQSQKQ